MDGTTTLADALALCALILSLYATITTAGFNRRQKSMLETQERLNALLVDKENAQSASDRKADVSATLIKVGSSRYRCRVFNKGKCTARNVRVDFPHGNEIVANSDLVAKFPMERMEQHQSVDVLAVVGWDSGSKHAIRIVWDDDHAEDNEKILHLTH